MNTDRAKDSDLILDTDTKFDPRPLSEVPSPRQEEAKELEKTEEIPAAAAVVEI